VKNKIREDLEVFCFFRKSKFLIARIIIEDVEYIPMKQRRKIEATGDIFDLTMKDGMKIKLRFSKIFQWTLLSFKNVS